MAGLEQEQMQLPQNTKSVGFPPRHAKPCLQLELHTGVGAQRPRHSIRQREEYSLDIAAAGQASDKGQWQGCTPADLRLEYALPGLAQAL